MRHHFVPRSMPAIGSPREKESGGGGRSSTKAIAGRSARETQCGLPKSCVVPLKCLERRESTELIIGSDQKRQRRPGALQAELSENFGQTRYDPIVRELASGIDVIRAARNGEQLPFAPTLIHRLARDPEEFGDIADWQGAACVFQQFDLLFSTPRNQCGQRIEVLNRTAPPGII